MNGATDAESFLNTFQGTPGLTLNITRPLNKTTNERTKSLLKYYEDEAKALKDSMYYNIIHNYHGM